MEICKAVREAVGDDMVLMLDPFGVYTLEEALWVGREIEKLNFYWLEHPMFETRLEPYRRLTRELDFAVMAPEQFPGGVFTRARVGASGRVGHASNRLQRRRHHRLPEDGQHRAGVRHPVRNTLSRLDAGADYGGHDPGSVRVLRARPHPTRRRQRHPRPLAEFHLRPRWTTKGT